MNCGPSAGPLPSRPALAMCLAVNPPSIAVPSGDRSDLPAYSRARLGEGLQPRPPKTFLRIALPVPTGSLRIFFSSSPMMR